MPRDVSDGHLHPAFLVRLRALESDLAAAGIPLRRYEGARSPFRQSELFSLGRTTGQAGHTVTRARPYDSFHQFCLAADEVFFLNGAWTWDEPRPGMWAEYRQRAGRCGLRCLSFEQPHVEFPVTLTDLHAGRFPPDGGVTGWRDWLEEQAELWGLEPHTVNSLMMPGAPGPLLSIVDRPLLT